MHLGEHDCSKLHVHHSALFQSFSMKVDRIFSSIKGLLLLMYPKRNALKPKYDYIEERLPVDVPKVHTGRTAEFCFVATRAGLVFHTNNKMLKVI